MVDARLFNADATIHSSPSPFIDIIIYIIIIVKGSFDQILFFDFRPLCSA